MIRVVHCDQKKCKSWMKKDEDDCMGNWDGICTDEQVMIINGKCLHYYTHVEMMRFGLRDYKQTKIDTVRKWESGAYGKKKSKGSRKRKIL